MKNLGKLCAAVILSAAIFGMAVSFGAAQAASATANLEISATINPTCTITTTPIAFGVYDPVFTNLTAPLDGVGAVIITCSSGLTVITIGLDLGLNGSAPNRRMVNGTTNFLTYQLFKPDAGGFTTVWGNTAGPDLVAAAGTGLAQTYVVHGRVAGGQNPPNGSYSDTVLATVNF